MIDDIQHPDTPREIQLTKQNAMLKVAFGVLVILLLGGLGVFASQYVSARKSQSKLPTEPKDGVACTFDAKVCPDGSSVGRVPPKCEFAPCETSPINPASTLPSGWSTYTDESDFFQFSYPPGFVVERRRSAILVSSPVSWCTPMLTFNDQKYETLNNNQITFFVLDTPIQEYLGTKGGLSYGWEKRELGSLNGYVMYQGAEMIAPLTEYLLEVGKDKTLQVSSYVFGSDDMGRCKPALSVKDAMVMERLILSTLKHVPVSPYPTPTTNYDGDGHFFGSIKQTSNDNGRFTIDVDFVQWLVDRVGNDGADTTLEGTKACVEDKKCQEYMDSCETDMNGNCVESEWSKCNGTKCASQKCGTEVSCLPSGYYIRNQSDKIRTLTLDENAILTVLDPVSMTEEKPIRTVDFVSLFNSSDSQAKYSKDAIYYMVVKDNKLVLSRQLYRP